MPQAFETLLAQLKGPERTTYQTLACAMAGGLIFVLLGSFLPWATADFGGDSESVSGISGGGGVSTMVLSLFGLAGPVLALLGRPKAAIGGLVAAGLSLLIAVANMSDISSFSDFGFLGFEVSVGFGLWLVLLGALVACGTGIAMLINKPAVATA